MPKITYKELEEKKVVEGSTLGKLMLQLRAEQFKFAMDNDLDIVTSQEFVNIMAKKFNWTDVVLVHNSVKSCGKGCGCHG